MSSKEKLAFLVQIEERYDIRRVVTKVCRVTTSGELRRPSFGSGDLGAHLADFEVSAYLDRDNERAWCPGHYFDAFRVDLEQAESIIKVLRKLQKGMDKATRGARLPCRGRLRRLPVPHRGDPGSPDLLRPQLRPRSGDDRRDLPPRRRGQRPSVDGRAGERVLQAA